MFIIETKITIRSLSSIEDLENIRNLEAEIWGYSDSIPTHQTLTAVKNGGIILGAYINEKLVAFLYSFPGFNGKDIYLCSHILGTAKEYRNKGIGELLKREQYKIAQERGYSFIQWTYDPLETTNGYLNIGKLGGICETYIENCYGEMVDLLNGGLPSDRFLVQWSLTEKQEKNIPVFSEENTILKWKVGKENIPTPTTILPFPQADMLFVPVPSTFRIVREQYMEIALQWRLKTRTIFQQAFAEGWSVTDFIKNEINTASVHYYVLTKK
ncbi:MAG: GNAT family N-acetyltransferase [Bacillaceae bacterium]